MARNCLLSLFVSAASIAACSIAVAQNPAITLQLPTFGIAIDAEGVLSVKTYADPSGRLMLKRLAAARADLPADVLAKSKMRKVSLRKLEREVNRRVTEKEPLDDEILRLAGIQRIQYIFYLPKSRDILVAGPAEGWIEDLSGRAVGVSTGKPTLLLEDLIVALRAYGPRSSMDQFIGCTINPDREGLSRLREFQSTIPRTVSDRQREEVAKYIDKGMRESLGPASIQVFGVSSKTHFAQVLIEADYRMKRIGIGLEPPPVKMATFIGMLKRPQHSTLQRWWFTPNYECVRVTDDRSAMELVGQGVQLQGEDKLIGADGSLAATGAKSGKASELFTTSFTKKYEDISAASPVFAQLRNMIDVIIAAAFIRHEDYYARADWHLGIFGDEEALPVETLSNPRQVPCAVNVLWKGSRLLAPAGGGVSIRPSLALQDGLLLTDDNGLLAKQHEHVLKDPPRDRWWWD